MSARAIRPNVPHGHGLGLGPLYPAPNNDIDDPDGRGLYEQALALAASLERDEHYLLRPSERSIELTDGGRAAVAEGARGLPGLWEIPRARQELVEKGLSALHLYQLDRHYILAEGKVQIVDGNTLAG